MNVLVRTHIQTTAKEQGSSLVLSHSIQAHSTLIFTHLSPRHTQVHKKKWANVNKHAHTHACTESYPALFLAVPLPSPDLHHSMNKAAERWRKWAHIGKRKVGGVVWCLEQRDGGVGREKRGKEKHTHTYTLAKTNRFSSISPPWNDSFSSVSRPHLQQCSQRRQQRAFSKHRGCRALKQQKCLATASGLTPEGRLALSESETKAASAWLWVIESPCRLSSTFEQQFGTFCQ